MSSLLKMLLVVLVAAVIAPRAFPSTETSLESPARESAAGAGLLRSGFVTLAMGPVWYGSGQAQTLEPVAGFEKTYTAGGTGGRFFSGEIFLGIHRPVSDRLRAQVGLDVATTSSAAYTGDVWDEADPQFDNRTYSYSVEHTHVGLKSKLLVEIGSVVVPWVSAGLGLAFNNAHGFTNTPKIAEAVVEPNYSDHMATALYYSVGLGARTALAKDWHVGLGYTFSNLGKSRLGTAAGQTRGNGPALSSLTAHGLMLSLSYGG